MPKLIPLFSHVRIKTKDALRFSNGVLEELEGVVCLSNFRQPEDIGIWVLRGNEIVNERAWFAASDVTILPDIEPSELVRMAREWHLKNRTRY